MKRLTWSCAVILSACGLSSCKDGEVDEGVPSDPSGTDTGNPFDEPGNDLGEGTGGGACEEVVTDVELGTETALGFSAETVLAFAGGTHREALAWLDSGVEYGPESGRSGITLTVEPLAAHFVDRSPRTSGSGGLTIDIGTLDGCRDSIKIDVRIGIDSEGGALAEVVDTVLEASAADFASGSFAIDLAAISGSFQAMPTAPANSELTRSSLQVELGLSQYGAVGSVSLFNEFRSLDGNAAGVGGGGPIAHFPADDYCGQANSVSVTADQPVRGVSMAAALAGLNSEGSVPVRYRGGANSTLAVSFTSTEERVCVSFDRDQQYDGEAGGAVLSFSGRATLDSADGRIDGSFPVTIHAMTQDGSLRFDANAQQNAQNAAQAAAFPPAFGIQDDIDFSAYGGGSVVFQSLALGEMSGGSLVVNGFVIPECISNPQPPPPGATSVGGCQGIDLVPLWSATWGDSTF
jgi:hypothetical protein